MSINRFFIVVFVSLALTGTLMCRDKDNAKPNLVAQLNTPEMLAQMNAMMQMKQMEAQMKFIEAQAAMAEKMAKDSGKKDEKKPEDFWSGFVKISKENINYYVPQALFYSLVVMGTGYILVPVAVNLLTGLVNGLVPEIMKDLFVKSNVVPVFVCEQGSKYIPTNWFEKHILGFMPGCY